jgi:asparaginyl-tRNA synthetase
MFQITAFDLGNIPKTDNNTVDYSRDFFGKKASLTVSGQLEAEIMALGLGRVYTFAPTFRAENSNTARHLSEFWMIEPEMAFFDINDNMSLAEDFLKSIINRTMEECSQEYEFFSRFIEKDLEQKLRVITDSRFERITYTQAVDILVKNNQAFEFKVEWGSDLQSEHEKYLTETVFKKPVIVYNYPEAIKAFYMRMNDDGRTVAAMDILVPRIGEIIGGSQREERYDVLINRIREKGLKEEEYWWYLDLRRFCSVPHSGFGLGFERMLQFLTGMSNIRDVIPFPRVPGLLEF